MVYKGEFVNDSLFIFTKDQLDNYYIEEWDPINKFRVTIY